jgi:hypothetical protein
MTRKELFERKFARAQRWIQQRTGSQHRSHSFRIPAEIKTAEQADVVLQAYFIVGDPILFARHIKAMGDWHFRSSVAAMRESGDSLSEYDEFMALLRHCKIISLAQLEAYNNSCREAL